MKQFILLFIITFVIAFLFLYLHPLPIKTTEAPVSPVPHKYWKVQSIDTMKHSRDGVQDAPRDFAYYSVIDKQISNIAAAGATHVAINTPYDEEFLPVMRNWVASAREHNLKVWYRGNFSGWEGWFKYKKISRVVHIQKTEKFIVDNPDLFEDGDIFTACPECENGDTILEHTRDTEQVKNYRTFLIQEHQAQKRAFNKINKKVIFNYNSMNGFLATVIMDPETTQALDGVVGIDHYVATPEQLVTDIRALAIRSGGKIVLGEFGAPIPDIHGDMTEAEQKDWVDKTLKQISEMPEVIAINYWVNMGGSTPLWRDDGTPKPVLSVIKKYYQR